MSQQVNKGALRARVTFVGAGAAGRRQMSVAAMCMTLAALVSAAASERLPIAIVSERAEVIASVRAAAAIAHLPAVVVASADLATVLEPSRFSWLALADAPALPADAAPAYMRFAEAGRGLVLLGGKPPRLNASHAQLMINVMSTYPRLPYSCAHPRPTRSPRWPPRRLGCSPAAHSGHSA